MRWYQYLGFSSWGGLVELLVALFMGGLAFSYGNINVFERYFYAFLVFVMTWLLAWMVRWTCVWIGESLKK